MPTKTIVNIHYAKTHLSRLLERVQRGERITIAKAGDPVAELVPIAAGKPRVPGGISFGLDGRFFEPLPDDELDRWEP